MTIFEKADIKNVDEKVRQKAKEIGYPKRGLYICGEIGTGKTYLAIAIAKHCSRGNFLFLKVQDLIRKIRMCETAIEEDRTIWEIVKQRHLIIDDLGTEKTTDFSSSLIYEVIDKRCIYNPEAIIITSNLSITELYKTNPRIASRIIEMCGVIKLEGKDRRVLQNLTKAG